MGRHVANILIVWMLTGLWHGSAWNFIIWGLYYGLLLLLESIFWQNIWRNCRELSRRYMPLFLPSLAGCYFPQRHFPVPLPSLEICLGSAAMDLWIAQDFIIWAPSDSFGHLLFLFHAFCVEALQQDCIEERCVAFCGGGRIYTAIIVLSLAYLVNATYSPFLYFQF